MKTPRLKLWRGRRPARGQAMVEYSTITFALLGGALALGWPYLNDLIDGISAFYESIYYVIQSPIP